MNEAKPEVCKKNTREIHTSQGVVGQQGLNVASRHLQVEEIKEHKLIRREMEEYSFRFFWNVVI